MNKFLRKFDIIRFVAHLSIFRKFLKFFHFLNSNLNFKFKPVWYRPKPDQFPPVWWTLGTTSRTTGADADRWRRRAESSSASPRRVRAPRPRLPRVQALTPHHLGPRLQSSPAPPSCASSGTASSRTSASVRVRQEAALQRGETELGSERVSRVRFELRCNRYRVIRLRSDWNQTKKQRNRLTGQKTPNQTLS